MRCFPPLLALFTCVACTPIVVDRRGSPPPAPLPPPVVYEPAPVDRHDDDRRPARDQGERGEHRIDVIIDRAYRDLLERAPDPEGREHYWRLLREGLTEEQMRHCIRESVEYRVTLPDAKTTRAYQQVLGRDPDRSGLESYRKKIVDKGWSEHDVENDLRRSAEFRARQQGGAKPDADQPNGRGKR
jgi:hypothetical protein